MPVAHREDVVAQKEHGAAEDDEAHGYAVQARHDVEGVYDDERHEAHLQLTRLYDRPVHYEGVDEVRVEAPGYSLAEVEVDNEQAEGDGDHGDGGHEDHVLDECVAEVVGADDVHGVARYQGHGGGVRYEPRGEEVRQLAVHLQLELLDDLQHEWREYEDGAVVRE